MMEEEFDVESLEVSPEGDAFEILSFLDNDPDFQEKIENLISKIHEENFNLTKIHEKIISIINLSFRKIIIKDEIKAILDKLDESTSNIDMRINEVSAHLMLRRNLGIYVKVEKLEDFQITKACENLKAMMKRFIIYEIYKLLNPRRIAGETKLENFISNFLIRGEKVARKFEGGSDADLRKYSPALLKALRKKRKQIISKGGAPLIKPK